MAHDRSDRKMIENVASHLYKTWLRHLGTLQSIHNLFYTTRGWGQPPKHWTRFKYKNHGTKGIQKVEDLWSVLTNDAGHARGFHKFSWAWCNSCGLLKRQTITNWWISLSRMYYLSERVIGEIPLVFVLFFFSVHLLMVTVVAGIQASGSSFE